MRAIWLVIGLSMTASGQDVLVLEGPKEAPRADLEKCASVMARRCLVRGIKGIKGSVVETDGKLRVELASREKLSEEARKSVETLARVAGRRAEFKMPRSLTPEEKSAGFTLGNPADLSTSKIPPGTSWVRRVENDFQDVKAAGGGPVSSLTRDTPAVDFSEVSADRANDTMWTYAFSEAATRKLQKEISDPKKKEWFKRYFLLFTFDGNLVWTEDIDVNFGEQKSPLKRATFTLPVAFAEVAEAVFRNPMPHALKLAK
ncbi:MAG: hypothetical protein HYY18_03565 [Planctomycetes bacterium]|nr:hypothetical protein [Planctomycetota bacterium]